jgi:hypothetical protein
MKHKNSQLLYAYWNTARGDRIAPRRFDIEPGRLGAVLPETFILESRPSGVLAYRLAGTRLCEGLGLDLRGRDFLEGLSLTDKNKLKPYLASVIGQGAVLLQTLEIENSAGSKGTVEVLLLPLTHTRDSIDRFLGCIVWLTEPIDLKEHKIVARRLLTCALVWPNGEVEPPVLTTPKHSDPARQTPFLPHIRNARIVRQDRRQFRVYDGGLTKQPLDKS